MKVRSLEFSIPGDPVGKGRPRFTKAGFTYTPAKTHNYESLVSLAFQSSFPDWIPTEEPLQLEMRAYFSIPKSWSQKKKNLAASGMIQKVSKPDTDNIAKIKDALNGIAWKDDAQVWSEKITKQYSEKPRLDISIIMGDENE